MKVLSYLILNKIRNMFTANRQQSFDYYKYSEHYQKRLLKRTLKELNESNVINDKSIIGKIVEGKLFVWSEICKINFWRYVCFS